MTTPMEGYKMTTPMEGSTSSDRWYRGEEATNRGRGVRRIGGAPKPVSGGPLDSGARGAATQLKKKRYRPGTRALMKIRQYKRSVNFLIRIISEGSKGNCTRDSGD